jgi:MYXO-CTERM domain-containing protein
VLWKTTLGVSVALSCHAGVACAYTIQSVVTEGCHERITSQALRDVRSEQPELDAITPDENEQALVDDLQFSPDDDMLDLAAVTLLLGVRDNDLKGRGADELDELSQVHGNPDAQDEHCLRSVEQDEPSGSQEAIAACRAFIEKRIEDALAGLDEDGWPDAAKRIDLPIHLAIRGDIDASLPLFYVRMGQALHTLQDGFSHTYRTSDGERVTVALNWLDLVDKSLDEARDGPGHLSDLDSCDDADELRRTRRELATRASTEVLREALTAGTRDERMARVRLVLDRYIAYEPGCSFENAWCDAPESSYDASTCACESAGIPGSRGALIGLALLALVAGVRSRRRAPFAAAAIALCALPGIAMAQEPPPEQKTEVIPSSDPEKPPITATQTSDGEKTTTTVVVPKEQDAEAPPPPNIVPVKEPGPPEPNAIAFGGAVTLSGSVDKPGFAGGVGARLRLHKHWAIGLDAEWNPWISLTGGEPVRSGAANIYASGFLRFPLLYEQFNLRTQLSLGTSVLLSDLYGAPKGSAGLFVGANFLGLEFKASDYFYLIINPLGVAIPIPQLEGVPFLYPQYRLQLGLEFYEG